MWSEASHDAADELLTLLATRSSPYVEAFASDVEDVLAPLEKPEVASHINEHLGSPADRAVMEGVQNAVVFMGRRRYGDFLRAGFRDEFWAPTVNFADAFADIPRLRVVASEARRVSREQAPWPALQPQSDQGPASGEPDWVNAYAGFDVGQEADWRLTVPRACSDYQYDPRWRAACRAADVRRLSILVFFADEQIVGSREPLGRFTISVDRTRLAEATVPLPPRSSDTSRAAVRQLAAEAMELLWHQLTARLKGPAASDLRRELKRIDDERGYPSPDDPFAFRPIQLSRTHPLPLWPVG